MLFDSQSNKLNEEEHGFPVADVQMELCRPLLISAFRPPLVSTVAISAFGKRAIGKRTADGLLRITYAETKEAPLVSHGPGTELKKLLAMVGIHASSNCGCNKMADEMNRLGPDWCRENMDVILGSMESEAKKRRLPFSKILAIAMVEAAIFKSRIH